MTEYCVETYMISWFYFETYETKETVSILYLKSVQNFQNASTFMCALTHSMCVSQSTMSVKSKITNTHVYGCVCVQCNMCAIFF